VFASQELCEPIKARRQEYELQPGALEELRSSLQLTRKAVEQYRAGDERYAHLSEDEIERVVEEVSKAQRWLDNNAAALNAADKHKDPQIKVSAIREQKNVSCRTCLFQRCLPLQILPSVLPVLFTRPLFSLNC